MTSELWESIVRQLKFDIQSIIPLNIERSVGKTIYPVPNHIFEGIIHYLNEATGGWCYKNGTIEVSCSSKKTGVNKISCQQLFGSSTLIGNKFWTLNDEFDCYLEVDFKNVLVCLSHYSMHTPLSRGEYFPKSWSVEGSNDHVNWIILDTRVSF